jgi:hypothetical protein
LSFAGPHTGRRHVMIVIDMRLVCVTFFDARQVSRCRSPLPSAFPQLSGMQTWIGVKNGILPRTNHEQQVNFEPEKACNVWLFFLSFILVLPSGQEACKQLRYQPQACHSHSGYSYGCLWASTPTSNSITVFRLSHKVLRGLQKIQWRTRRTFCTCDHPCYYRIKTIVTRCLPVLGLILYLSWYHCV